MSTRTHKPAARDSQRDPRRSHRRCAPLFAALGDETRLALLHQLGDGAPRSIARLTDATSLTRQAVTKHLRILEDVGLVRHAREGRETHYRLDPKPLHDAKLALDAIAQQWDDALARLKAFVE